VMVMVVMNGTFTSRRRGARDGGDVVVSCW
jgi:hypothetical protein